MKPLVLIIEDDPLAQKFYSLIFNKNRFSIIVSENGDEIWHALENCNISIIICDVNLRNTFIGSIKVNGIEITKILKNDPKYKHIPIILITALSKKTGGKNLLQESGADHFIPKPIEDFEAFLNEVEDYILL